MPSPGTPTRLGQALLGSMLLVAASLPLGAAGCDGVGPRSAVVGGLCRDDRDCRYLCVQSPKLPGVCSLPCRNDLDCPAGSACIDHEGGVCAVECFDSPRGRDGCDAFGPEFSCEDERRRGPGGRALVCVAD